MITKTIYYCAYCNLSGQDMMVMLRHENECEKQHNKEIAEHHEQEAWSGDL